MLILTADIIARARDPLQDLAGVRYLDVELKRYILDGMVAIVDKAPWASTTVQQITHALAVGIEQSIETHGVRTVSRVLDVTFNQTGSTYGKAIRKLSKDQLDAQRPSWPTEAPSRTVLNWMPDEQIQNSFLVYPPALSGASVRAQVVFVPNSAEVIELRDNARDALVYYVVHKAWSKDAEYAKGSLDYKQMFDAELNALMGANKLASDAVQQRQRPR